MTALASECRRARIRKPVPHECSAGWFVSVQIRCAILVLLIIPWAAPAPVLSQDQSPYLSREEILPVSVPFEMPHPQRPYIPARSVDIRDFGAREGGLSKNTAAIRSAIHAVASRGGGTVLIPPGKWLTGPIHLEDSVNLHLLRGAELVFSQEFADYLPVVFSRHEDIECFKYSAFVYADGKTNIAITGEGTLNGQGKPWWSWKTEKKSSEQLLNTMAADGLPVDRRVFDGTNGRELRPAFFQPMRCTNVLVEGVTFLYGAFWTVTPTYCTNVIVRRVRIVTEGPYGHTPNGDGVDPSSSKNVLIEECEFDTGDDCIAIKAGRDRDGLRVSIPTENVVIRNCRGLRGHGGIVIGSETSGGIRNIYAEHCTFSGTDRVVRIKTARGRGGVLENMWFRNLTGENILAEALRINMLYTGTRVPARTVGETTPVVRNIHYDSISVSGAKTYVIEIIGLPEMPVENISFTGIVAEGAKGVNLSDVREIEFHGCRVIPATGPLVRVLEGRNITLDGLSLPAAVKTVMEVEGSSSGAIRFVNTDRSQLEGRVILGQGVPKGAVTIGK